jgi:non-canonical (house-cleaning) NTP pyrophosphatase
VDLREFWRRLKTGVEVTVAGQASDKLLGVRDGFLRFFQERHLREVSIVVVPQTVPETAFGLLASDEQVIRSARQSVRDIESRFGADYHFFVSSDGGAHSLDVDGEMRYFVRNWTVIRCALGEAWGASGSVQLPQELVSQRTEGTHLAFPGTRRRGGIISSLTGGLETRRSAVGEATLHALSTLFYGMLERSRPT